MPEGSVTPDTRLVLTNAIYFNGKWTSPFTTSMTSQQNFQLGSGGVESVSMMHQESDLDFGTFQNFSMLEMPYQGSSLSMVVILPNATNGLAAVEKSLNPQTLAQDESKLSSVEVKVGLPKFTINSTLSLGATLANMGMPAAFTQQANFSGMDGQPDLQINSVNHDAYINVTKAGTEAAAATGIGITSFAVLVDPTPPAVFDANHPFDYLIVNNKSGSLLFMGRVTDPGGALLTSPLPVDSFFSSSSEILLSTRNGPLAGGDPAPLGASAIAARVELPPLVAVPEPSTLVLVVAGIIGLIVFGRR